MKDGALGTLERNGRCAPRYRRLLWIAAIAWLSAALSYLVSEGLAALAFSPPYSYAKNYISDLGVPVCGAVFDGRPICSPLHWLMNTGFVFQGGLFVVAALAVARSLSTPARRAFVGCAALNGVGIGLVGLFPETAAQLRLHALGAFSAIVFGNATAFVSAFAFKGLGLPRLHRVASLTLPLLAAIAFSILLLARARAVTIGLPDGVWERASVYTITAWELLSAACLATRDVRTRGT